MTLTPPTDWDIRAESRDGSYTPRWVLSIARSGGTTYTATRGYTSGVTWETTLLSVSDVRYEIPENDAVGTVAGATVQIRRDSTYDTYFDDHTLIGNSCTLGLGFADQTTNLTMGTLIVANVRFPDVGVIEMRLVRSEIALGTIPVSEVDSSSYTNIDASVPEDGKPAPIVLGSVENLESGDAGTLAGLFSSLCAEPFCVATRILGRDTNTGNSEYIFLIDTGAGQTTQFGYAFEYVPEFEGYAILMTHETTWRYNWDFITHDSHRTIGVYAENYDLSTPSLSNVGGMRQFWDRLDDVYVETGNSNHNLVLDWADLSGGGEVLTDSTYTRLTLKQSADRSQPRNATLAAVYMYWGIVTASDGSDIKLYEGTVSTDAKGSALATYNTGGFRYTALATEWDKSDRFYLFENQVNGVGTSEMGIARPTLVYWYVRPYTIMERHRYKDVADPRERVIGYQKKTWYPYKFRTEAVNAMDDASRIFVNYRGPNATIQPNATSYTYNTLPYVVYYLLGTVLGISSSYIDGDSFDDVYAYLVTDSGGNFNTHQIGRQIYNYSDALPVIAELCMQYGVMFYLGADNKWKIRMRNVAGTPVATFSDAAEDYPCWDFSWDYSDQYTSRFRFNYHWNPGVQEFNKHITVDKDATVSSFLTSSKTACTTANSNYYGETELTTVDCYWAWGAIEVENIAKILINWHTYLRRRVRFTTKLSAAILEPGDTIRTNHQSQTWSSTSIDFQVRSVAIDQQSQAVTVEAFEINEL